MTKLNQFESVFKSADKTVFVYRRVKPERVLVISDFVGPEADALTDQVRAFLSVIDDQATRWSHMGGEDFDTVKKLLDQVEERNPDLIVTYRHLHSGAWQWPYSLGEYLDVLTQVVKVPVVVLPHPGADRALPHSLKDTDRVMAITDHLTGDERLANFAVRFTKAGGTCWLTHIESTQSFDRYMDAISKIPEIDTDSARELIQEQLLKEPRDYIRSCRQVIEGERLAVLIEEIVTMGRRLAEYERLIEEHRIDLLVLNTMDEGQLAMHGLAYPLAVELRQIPLLML